MSVTDFYIGVDVGTGSARAALCDGRGTVIRMARQDIRIWNDSAEHYEQSSEDIWTASCKVIKEVCSDTAKENVKGIGFDATCSLVVLDANFRPIPVHSKQGSEVRDIIMWMDHRAGDQTKRINSTQHPVLRYIGGSVSSEMEMPKLLWLKENLPSTWSRVGHVFDLPDYLTWRSTGSLSRSLCSLVCKWNYQCRDDGAYWPDDFIKMIGLDDLLENEYEKIGRDVRPLGVLCGSGLTVDAAKQLDLLPGTAVATSILDAHAGSLGCLASRVAGQDISIENRLSVICGTSTCHMLSSKEAKFVPGVWGPYRSVVVPGLWTNEAGQSAAGKLIDHVIETHAAYGRLTEQARSNGRHLHSELNHVLDSLARTRTNGSLERLTRKLHVYPDFHGNRSPVADPNLKGMICGLNLESGIEELAILYLATIQALAYSTRHIIETLVCEGHVIKAITVCGGLSKNRLYVQTHADVTGIVISSPEEAESVLLGAAILAMCASGAYPDVESAVRAVNGNADLITPREETRSYHDKKYRVFRAMLDHQRQYDQIMDS